MQIRLNLSRQTTIKADEQFDLCDLSFVGNITDWIFERKTNYTCGGADDESVLFQLNISVATKKGVENWKKHKKCA